MSNSIIPWEGESIRKDASVEEAAGKSVWAQLPVAKLPKESQRSSGPRGGVLMGPDRVTSDGPTRAGSDLRCVLAGLLLLTLPSSRMWDGDAGRGVHLPWERWKRLQYTIMIFCIFLFMADHESGLCKHWWFDCRVLIRP